MTAPCRCAVGDVGLKVGNTAQLCMWQQTQISLSGAKKAQTYASRFLLP